MKKYIPLIFCLILISNSCKVIDPYSSESYIFQQYFVSASRQKTSVEATAYFQRLGNFKKTEPLSKIEFNGTELKKGVSKSESDDLITCDPLKTNESENPGQGLVVLTPEPTPTSDTEQYKYFAALNGYQNENNFLITDGSGKKYPFTIFFEPVEPVNPDAIILSRSKNSTIQLKGKGSGKQKDIKYYVTQGNGKFIDEESAPYDAAGNRINIASSLTRKLSKGKALFYLASENLEMVDPNKSWTGFFTIMFVTEVCAEIVD